MWHGGKGGCWGGVSVMWRGGVLGWCECDVEGGESVGVVEMLAYSLCFLLPADHDCLSVCSPVTVPAV